MRDAPSVSRPTQALPHTAEEASVVAEQVDRAEFRAVGDIDVPCRVIVRVLRKDMAVEMRHPMSHHQIVDLPRLECRRDRSSGSLYVRPEPEKLLRGEICEIGDVFAVDHE